MKQQIEKAQQINDLGTVASSDRDEEGVNGQRTGTKIDAPLTQPCSPTVPGWTYFIRVDGAIKIGSASNFKSRLHALQTAHERPIEVLAVVPSTIADEYRTHQKFSHLRIRGEWFRAEPDLLAFIEAMKASEPVEKEPDPVISGLHLLRKKHGFESAIGYRCSNLSEMIPNYQMATDPEQRAKINKSIGRTLAELAALQSQSPEL